jgi:hypothetical protein
MLVGPCSVATRGMNHPENCVGADEVPGINRRATVCRVADESAGIDRSNAAVSRGRPAVKLRLININAFVIFGGGAGEHTRRAGAAGESIAGCLLWGCEATVISNVVERAHRAR